MFVPIENPVVRNVDPDSVLRCCEESKQAMVYGFTHCGYGALCAILSGKDSPLKKMYDCTLGNPDRTQYNLEGRELYQINPDLPTEDTPEANISICNRMCKAGITNLVIENYKRSIESLPLIPVIFSVDSDDLPLDPKCVASRDEKLNGFLTHKELRRCYKLCNEFPDADFQQIARATFKFLKLTKGEGDTFNLVQVNPFWERGQGWEQAWLDRKKTSEKKNPEKVDWKDEVQEAIRLIKRESIKRV